MQGFRLGSIFGFKIQIDFSWFAIFLLILWTLSRRLFPAEFPALSSQTHLVMGIVATVLFFISILIHELSHSLVARAKGIPVDSITLFIFGSVASGRRDAETPGEEFQIAGIGPLTSIVIAILSGAVAGIGSLADWSIAAIGVARYLANINAILAIFNLLPGFPLDGGRVFRAIVWKLTGNLTTATRIASTAGQVLGFSIVLLGILQLFNRYLLNGLWFVLIGWFLQTTAEMGYQEQLLRVALEGVRARDIMTRHPETVSPELTVRQLVDDYFFHRRFHAFPVARDNRPLGIVTFNRVKEVPQNQWDVLTVRDVMHPMGKNLAIHPDEKMLEVLPKMEATDTRRVLVLSDGRLEGIITAEDIAGWLRRVGELERWKQKVWRN
jgi:Zn-dependent protease/CBS domain-containing protein